MVDDDDGFGRDFFVLGRRQPARRLLEPVNPQIDVVALLLPDALLVTRILEKMERKTLWRMFWTYHF
jgi:hypothetical protein